MLDQSSFAQIKVTVCKQVFPFEQQLPSLFLLWFRPFCETLEVQSLQNPSFWCFVTHLFSSPGWVDHWWCLVGRNNLSNPGFCGYFHDMDTQVVQADGYPQGSRMQFSIGCHGHHCCWQLGTWCWFHENMNPHAVSFDTGTSMHIDCAEWWNSDLLCGADWTFNIIDWTFTPPQGHPLERSPLSPLLSYSFLSCHRRVAVTLTWLLQNEPVAMSWLPWQVPP